MIIFLGKFNYRCPITLGIFFFLSMYSCFLPLILLKKDIGKKWVTFFSFTPFFIDVLFALFILLCVFVRRGVIIGLGCLGIPFVLLFLIEILLWICLFSTYYFNYESIYNLKK